MISPLEPLEHSVFAVTSRSVLKEVRRVSCHFGIEAR